MRQDVKEAQEAIAEVADTNAIFACLCHMHQGSAQPSSWIHMNMSCFVGAGR